MPRTNVRQRTEAVLVSAAKFRTTPLSPPWTMTSRVRTSTYKGAHITVRWQELKRGDSPSSLFIAGYRLKSTDGKQTDWCDFDTHTFHTYDTAVAYALGQAHRFIDAQGSTPSK